MQKQFKQVLPGNDCYLKDFDLGYQGVKSFEEISKICAANPKCNGFRGSNDWWLLSKIESTGPQHQNHKCYQALAPSCTKPKDWCSHKGAVYRNIDRVGDGVLGDHICLDDKGNTGTIFRTDNCQVVWPNGSIKKNASPSTVKSIPPCAKGTFCSHPGAVYRNMDLLGDGINGDHICLDDKGNNGIILRTNNCTIEWPNAKPFYHYL